MLLLVMASACAAPLYAQPAHEVGTFLQQEATRVAPLPGEANAPPTVSAIAVAGDTTYALAGGRVLALRGDQWLSVSGVPGDARHLANVGDEMLVAGDSWAAVVEGTQAQPVDLPSEAVVVALAPGPRRTLVTRSHLLTHETGQWHVRAVPATPIAAAQAPDGRVALVAGGEVHECATSSDACVRVPLQNADEGWLPPGLSHVAYDTRGRLWFASAQGIGVRDSDWRFIDPRRGLPVLGITGMAAGSDGDMWLATTRGAVHVTDTAIEYRQGRRWLPGDDVAALTVDDDGAVWLATDGGIGTITPRATTLSAKAAAYEAAISRHHQRTPYRYVVEAWLARPGDVASATTRDNDNDGLWTGMYGAAQCFAYAATGSEAARTRARRAFDALRFLGDVTRGGPHAPPDGFVARSVVGVSEADPNSRDNPARDRVRRETVDARWKVLDPRWPKSADGQWYWKSDTSSDELDGHYFFYALYHDLVAQDAREQSEVADVVRALTDHLLAHDYTLTDHDGQPTRWAVFGPSALNADRLWHEERGLNSLSMLTYLRIAAHVTGESRYDAAARTLVASHGYAMNLLHSKVTAGIGGGNQSDDEMAFMNYYHLLAYEQDPEVRQAVARSLHDYWQLERPERNPLFNLIAAISLRDTTYADAYGTQQLSLPDEAWLPDTIDTLVRFPTHLIDWGLSNSHRLDVQPLPAHVRPEGGPATGLRMDGKVLPIDERMVFHWNHDPYELDYTGTGLRLADGTSFLLPYYMALHHRILLPDR